MSFARRKTIDGLVAVSICLILLLYGCRAVPGKDDDHLVRQGAADLTAWNFAKDGSINLNGDWEFYWHQLIPPQKFSTAAHVPMTGFFTVPGVWNDREINGKKLTGDGFATFRARVALPQNSPLLAVRVLDETSAYRLWVNGKLVAANGAVGTNHATTKPQYLLQLAKIPSDQLQLDIVLQVANFNHSKGGVWNPVTLGAEADLLRTQELKWGLDYFLFGCLLIMGAYHVSMFLLKRQNYSLLYFGLFCLDVACRTAVTENRFLTFLFPEFPWEFVFKLELITVHAGFLLLLLFIHSLYSTECSFRLMRILKGICLAFALVALVSSARISSLLVEPFHPLILFIQGYICYVLIRAIMFKRNGAATILTGLLVFFLAVINDILHNRGVVSTAYVAQFGFLFLVCTQSLVLARRYSQAFIAAEQLSVEREEHIQALSSMNAQIGNLVSTLQREVEEHTAAGRALETEMAERIRLECEIIKISDNERLQISHDIHDGLCQQLTGARLHCAALESRLVSGGTRVVEVEMLGQLLDDAVNHAYDLSRGLCPLELDSKDLAAPLEELIRRLSRQGGPVMKFHQKLGCGSCSTDQLTQMYRIAREAITNAVKHSKATLVTVSMECNFEEGFVLKVRDNGVGRSMAAKKNGGMGIGIMRHRAVTIGGKLDIRDSDEGGTLVVCTAPCSRIQSGEKLLV